jgi:hypothetical protein
VKVGLLATFEEDLLVWATDLFLLRGAIFFLVAAGLVERVALFLVRWAVAREVFFAVALRVVAWPEVLAAWAEKKAQSDKQAGARRRDQINKRLNRAEEREKARLLAQNWSMSSSSL